MPGLAQMWEKCENFMGPRRELCRTCRDCRALALLFFADSQSALDGIHDRHVEIEPAVVLDLVGLALQGAEIDDGAAVLAVIIAAQPHRHRLGRRHGVEQELLAGDFCHIHRDLRLARRRQQHGQKRGRHQEPNLHCVYSPSSSVMAIFCLTVAANASPPVAVAASAPTAPHRHEKVELRRSLEDTFISWSDAQVYERRKGR